ncbi:tropinone reductase-like 3 [Cucumis melo var. makuwa]|uniref:Tropinone reductase-like 3 n=1 Tax=Cucumis melo var. makuwa TaxID=1194695 RepID=A0A5A7UGM4_CUCMM|nr:tropinone reductase-like 3 [Cucumis melo var. makuwa]TYK12341.1 tropinone reductase-like 3 [Cucumis melo var. makuwa]
MDFIEGLPKSNGFEVSLVVVYRVSKYGHFLTLKHPYTAKTVADLFIKEVVRLHGYPKSIVSARDKVFLSNFWKELFKMADTKLNRSTAYHPQSNGKIEVVNRGVETYLHCFCGERPKEWARWLHWAEYWYNTTSQRSLGITPFQAVYGRLPPPIYYGDWDTPNSTFDEQLKERVITLGALKEHLRIAPENMKRSVDKKRREVEYMKNVDEAVEKLKAEGLEVLGIVCHVSNAQQRKNLVEKTIQKYGKIDVVVSNAAVNPSVDSILKTQESVLDKLWDINVKASVLLLQDVAPHLQRGSSVVLISSIEGYQPSSLLAMYGVTKTALLGLTKALAAEMAPDTRVNCVAPGFVPTHFADFLVTNEAVRKGVESKTLLNRLGTTEDMAAATAFLASDDASYITGETLVVAGGMPSRL